MTIASKMAHRILNKFRVNSQSKYSASRDSESKRSVRRLVDPRSIIEHLHHAPMRSLKPLDSLLTFATEIGAVLNYSYDRPREKGIDFAPLVRETSIFGKVMADTVSNIGTIPLLRLETKMISSSCLRPRTIGFLLGFFCICSNRLLLCST